MMIVLALALGYAAVRVGLAAFRSLRQLPRRNDDMVFF